MFGCAYCNRIKRNYFLIALLCFFSILMVMCFGCGIQPKRSDKQTEYHTETAELEQYVLARLGDYIWFDEPLREENNTRLTLYIYLTTDYTFDEMLLEEYPPFAVAEDTRDVINEFMESNPLYLGEDWSISCFFSYPADGSSLAGTVSYEIEYWNNVIDGTCYNQLCTVEFQELVDPELIHVQGIRKVILNHYSESDESVSQILDIIRRLPDLEEVVVNSYNADRVREEYPNLRVVDC